MASTPPVSALITRGSDGSAKKFTNCASFAGWSMLKRSFDPVPMISSLMSGLPMRCTWRNRPDRSGTPLLLRRTDTRGREVVPQIPSVAAAEVAGSTRPVLVNSWTGISMAMVLTA